MEEVLAGGEVDMVRKEGWLIRYRTSGIRSRVKRWVVLRYDTLDLYKMPTDKAPVDTFYLGDAEIHTEPILSPQVALRSDEVNRLFAMRKRLGQTPPFAVSSPNRTSIFMCADASDQQPWLDAIHQTILLIKIGWTPTIHMQLPKDVQDDVMLLLMIARRCEWDLPLEMVHHICKFICYGQHRQICAD